MEDTLTITNNTKGKLPSLPLVFIKDDILGKKYTLSVVFVGEKKSKEINNKYRSKNRATNILSFSLDKNNGEMIMCPSVIKRESKNPEKNFGKNYRELLGFLVIHGMLHLKGYEHSSRMDREEEKYDKKYFSGDRHRHYNNTSSSGRVLQRRIKS